MASNRVLFIDICKFVAIFAVMFDHSAQWLTGLATPVLFGLEMPEVAYHMPLFMVLSGYFINVDKIKPTPPSKYLKDKAIRLLIPSIVCYVTMCIFTLKLPNSSCIYYYWFLNCMFMCYCAVYLTIMCSKHLWIGIIISLIVVLFLPMSNFMNFNYLYPFLWLGFGVRWFIDKRGARLVDIVLLLTASLVLYFYWDMSKSVYYCPFNVMNFSWSSLNTSLYRYAIGATVSLLIILIVCKIARKPNLISNTLASLGRETLFMYLGSFIINACLLKWLKIPEWFDYKTCTELYAFTYSSFLVASTYAIAKLLRRNRITRLLFLGEK